MIKSRGLSTYVIKECLSACTVVFLGGKERVIVPAARLGFHQPNFRGMTAADRKNAITAEIQRLQRLGLSVEFSQRANSAPPNAMWYPDQAELVRERVVTRVAQPAKPAAPKAAPPPASAAAPSANERPVAAAPSGSPPASVSGADQAVAPSATPRFETGRATLPADLVKRLVTQPRKPAPMRRRVPGSCPAPSCRRRQSRSEAQRCRCGLLRSRRDERLHVTASPRRSLCLAIPGTDLASCGRYERRTSPLA